MEQKQNLDSSQTVEIELEECDEINGSFTSRGDPCDGEYYKTNIYGEIRFPGNYAKRAKYICVRNSAKPTDVIQYMYGPEGFGLKKPKLMLCVAGSAKRLSVSQNWKKAFKFGLIKAAKKANAWIITGGLNLGVMRLVGEAVSEELSKDKLTVLGIASMGTVSTRDALTRGSQLNSKSINLARYPITNIEKYNDHAEASLNPNHTHFILYDDNTRNIYGQEVQFRANLENEIRKGKALRDYKEYLMRKTQKIPTVLIVVRGSYNTLKLISFYRKNVPILLCLGTSGCADLIHEAKNLTNKDKSSDQTLGKLIDDFGIVDFYLEKPDYEVMRADAINKLKDIVKPDGKDLIVSCALNTESDLQAGIVDALYKIKENLVQNIKLELLWNRYQISKTEALLEKIESLETKDLEELLQMALLENNFDFANALIGKIDLTKFLTIERFDKLYNSKKNSRIKDPFSQFLNHVYTDFELTTRIYAETIEDFFTNFIFHKFDAKFLPVNFCDENANQFVQDPELNLFIWSVLFNQIELAKLFWSIGDHQISNALLAVKILKIFSENLNDLKDQLLENAKEFESLAIGVMCVFDNNTKYSMNDFLKHTKASFLNIDCIDFAVHCKCKLFLALPSIQSVITERWYRKILYKNSKLFMLKFTLSLLSCGFLAPLLVLKIKKNKKANTAVGLGQPDSVVRSHKDSISSKNYDETSMTTKSDNDADQQIDNDEEKTINIGYRITSLLTPHSDTKPAKQTIQKPIRFEKWKNYWHNYIDFFKTPMVLYVYNMAFYMLFLALFSFTMLSKFHYFDEIDVYNNTLSIINTTSNLTGNNSNTTIVDNSFKTKLSIISPYEIVLMIWIFAFMIEEFYQFHFRIAAKVNSFKQNVYQYFDDQWNALDALGCVLFFIGIVLRVVSLWTNKYIFIWARILLSLDLSIWFIRSLYYCLAIRSVGPKLLMIRKMIEDLKSFLLIMIIVMFSYSLSAYSILFPQKQFTFDLILRVFNMGYWAIFGEISIIDELNHKNCRDNPEQCLEPTSAFVCSFLLMFYMIISAVLLINLVIAMFNSTYTKVEDKSDIHWKYQRYQLLSESKNFCFLPPPLNIIYYALIVPALYIFGLREVVRTRGLSTVSNVDEDVHKIIDEQKCAQKHLRETHKAMKNTIESKLDIQNERLDMLEQKIGEVNKYKNELNSKIEHLTQSNESVQKKLEEIFNSIGNANRIKVQEE